MDLGLADKRVLVTGGASGIGAAVSAAFAAEGARVAVADLAPGDASGATLTLTADVSDEADVGRMFTALDQQWGGIDVLINNAGLDGTRALGWEARPDQWTRVIEVNLKGAFLCAREALKRMVKAHAGVIINTSSVHEVIAWTGYSAYAASKAGLSMMAKTLAQEAAPHGVRVLCVSPGAIKTPINRSVWQDSRMREDLLRKIPLGRLGAVEDIASMAVFLASDRASYVTATSVFVDGGMTDYPDFARGG